MPVLIKTQGGIKTTKVTIKECQKERSAARLRGVAQETDHGECSAPGHEKNIYQIPHLEDQTKNKFSRLLEAFYC